MSAKVHAFYGFKGGAGRSLLLAHFASMLAVQGKSVLMIDSDLEAPGLGDFFDGVEQKSFERWRAEPGILDLLNDLFRAARRRELGEPGSENSVDAYMTRLIGTKNDRSQTGIIPFGNSSRQADFNRVSGDGPAASVHNDIWLLGPGDHRAQTNVNSSRYLESLLKFDWNAIMRSGGQDVLTQIGEYLRSDKHGFDHILIDARTGYNFSSLLLLQNFATHVVGVTSWNTQAIDGMARTLPVVASSAREGEEIRSVLVMNKGPDEVSDGHVSQHVKQEIIEAYFEEDEVVEYILYFPFVEGIQFRESLIWDRYFSAVDILKEEEIDKKVLTFQDPKYLRAKKVVEFVDSLTGLYYALTEDEFDVSRTERFRAISQQSERVEKFKSLTGTYATAKNNYTASESLLLVNTISTEAVNYFTMRCTPQDQEGETERTLRDELRKSFSTLDKDQRKLMRSYILRDLRGMGVQINDPNNDRRKEAAIQDLRSLFDLDLDPSGRVSVVAGALQNDRDDMAPNKLEAEDYSTIIRVFCQEMDSEEASRRFDMLISVQAAEQVPPDELSFVSYLIAWRNAHESSCSEIAVESILTGANCLNSALKELKGFPRPIVGRAFGRWNVYDTLGPFLTIVIRCFDVSPERVELRTALERLEESLMGCLSDHVPWLDSDKLTADLDLLHFQWKSYVLKAVELRRLLLPRKPYLYGLLQEAEFDAMLNAVGLPAPRSAKVWSFTADGQYEATEFDRLRASAIVHALEIAQTVYPVDQIFEWASVFAKKLLSHGMSRFTNTNEENISVLSKYEATHWSGLLDRLSVVCADYGHSPLSFQLSRRALRIYSNENIKFSEDDRSNSAVSMLTASIRLGARLNVDSFTEIKLTGFTDSESSDIHSGNIGLISWTAFVDLLDGRFRKAHEELKSSVDFRKSDEGQLPVNFGYAKTTIQILVMSLAQLGFIDEAVKLQDEYRAYASANLENHPGGVARNLLTVAQAIYWADPTNKAAIDTHLAECRALLPYVAEEYRMRYDFNCDVLSALVDPTLPIPKLDVFSHCQRYLQPLQDYNIQRLVLNPSPSWHGAGIFPGDAINTEFSDFLTFVHAPLIELAMHRQDFEYAEIILESWSKWINTELEYDDPRFSPVVCYGHALFHAFSFKFMENEEHAENARRFAQCDIDENGEARSFAYRGVFKLCGIST